MLSNETKLYRINEKLKPFNCHIEFGCFDLKTYKPCIYVNDKTKPISFGNYHFPVDLGLNVIGKKVYLYIRHLYPVNFTSAPEYWFYFECLKDLNAVIKYIDTIELEIPEYKG